MVNERKIPVIGILGGVASGKSFVAGEFARQGAVVLDADRAGHEVLRQPDVEQAIRGRFGDKVFDGDGHVVRSELAKLVFATTPQGRDDLEYLERLTHPRIGACLQGEIAEIERSGTAKVIVLDAPVLLKAGWNRYCDKIVFVEAPREARIERALSRGWTREEFVRREAAQESLDAKRKLADAVLDNSGPPESVRAEVERMWRQFVDPSPPK